MPKRLVATQVRLDPDQMEALRRLAQAGERSMAAELRIAVRRHLAATEPPPAPTTTPAVEGDTP